MQAQPAQIVVQRTLVGTQTGQVAQGRLRFFGPLRSMCQQGLTIHQKRSRVGMTRPQLVEDGETVDVDVTRSA